MSKNIEEILFRCAKLHNLVAQNACFTQNKPKMKTVNGMSSGIGAIEEFICPQCDKGFTIKDKLRDHVKTCAFKKAEEKACSLCDFTTRDPKQFRKHIKSNHGNKRKKCTLCDFTWTRYNHLKEHIELNHKGRQFLFPCNQCEFETDFKLTFKNHVKSVHDDGVNYECNQCDKQFISKGNVNRHILTVHNIGKRFSCEVCDFGASDKRVLLKHVLEKHPSENIEVPGVKSHVCKECGELFSRNYLLKQHVVSVHEGGYSCDQCNHEFKQKSDLQYHIKYLHRSVEHRCKECDYVAVRKPVLLAHMKAVHEGQKIPCPHCEYKGKWQADLWRHTKSMHMRGK